MWGKMIAPTVVPVPESDNPWPQEFRPYVEDEREYFFGRDWEREVVLANLLTSRVTVLHSPSGVGKSSVLRAAVIPDLKARAAADTAEDAPRLVVAYNRDWGANPNQSVRTALREALRAQAGLDLPAQLSRESDFAVTLCQLIASNHVHLFVILDQVEEVFMCPAQELSAFRDDLSSMLLGTRAMNLLIGIRQDWLGALEYFKEHIPAILDNRLVLLDLDKSGARDVIMKPAGQFRERKGGTVSVTTELADEICDQIQTGSRQVGSDHQFQIGARDQSARYPAAYLSLIMRQLWTRKGDTTVLDKDALRSIRDVRSVVQDHVDNVLEQFSFEDRKLAAVALAHLITSAGTAIEYPLKDIRHDVGWLSKDALPRVIDALESNRLIYDVGNEHYRLFHDLLIAPVRNWQQHFRSTESYAGFAHIFRKAFFVLSRAERELWWVNFVLRFGQPHVNNPEIAIDFRQYSDGEFADAVDGFFRMLCNKATTVPVVRILTLSKDGASEFLDGLRALREEAASSSDEVVTEEIPVVKEQLKLLRAARDTMSSQLAQAARSEDASKQSSSRLFCETDSLPIQLLIADRGADSSQLCCLAFMVGSEAYRIKETRQGIIGAHYTEETDVVLMYRNLAEVLMNQPNVNRIWPRPPEYRPGPESRAQTTLGVDLRH
jgi:hypothetical protein